MGIRYMGIRIEDSPVRDVTRDQKYKAANAIAFAFHEGDHVIKRGGDYTFDGIVLSAFRKRSGSPRYVVENEAGILHIFGVSQIELNNCDED